MNCLDYEQEGNEGEAVGGDDPLYWSVQQERSTNTNISQTELSNDEKS